MFIACQNLNFDFENSCYKILGDDIIIYNCLLAKEYVRLISSLGVEISSKKSIVGDSLFTFAKRLFTTTGEISPVSYNS